MQYSEMKILIIAITRCFSGYLMDLFLSIQLISERFHNLHHVKNDFHFYTSSKNVILRFV